VNTNAPIFKNKKVITGISGGEWGVAVIWPPTTSTPVRLAWKGYSTGPDDEMLIDPNKTTTWKDGKVQASGPILHSAPGRKTSGNRRWLPLGGWYSYEQSVEPALLRYRQPSTGIRPSVRDNKWSMSIWARNVDTGEVKWVYQMTPYDEWDFRGINEMILADINVKGKMTKALVHFDRNGFGYTLDRTNGALLVARNTIRR